MVKVTYSHRSYLRNELSYHIVVNGKPACNAVTKANWHVIQYNPRVHNKNLCTRCMFSTALHEAGVELGY